MLSGISSICALGLLERQSLSMALGRYLLVQQDLLGVLAPQWWRPGSRQNQGHLKHG
jgi:hypothetical protein